MCNNNGTIFITENGDDWVLDAAREKVPHKPYPMSSFSKIVTNCVINILINDEEHFGGRRHPLSCTFLP